MNYKKIKDLSVRERTEIYRSIDRPVDEVASYLNLNPDELAAYREKILSEPTESIQDIPKTPEFKLIYSIFGEIPHLSNDVKFLADQIDFLYQEETHNQIKEKLYEAIETLTTRERIVIGMRYGLDKILKENNLDVRTYTLEEVGKKYNRSRERIRQIQMKAERKLRSPYRSKSFENFFKEKKESLVFDGIREGKYGEGVKCLLSHLVSLETNFTSLQNSLQKTVDTMKEELKKHREFLPYKARKEIELKILSMLDQPIDTLELSVRAYNRLKSVGIETIGDLKQRTESELLKIRGFGRKTLRETKDILDEIGLHLEGKVLHDPNKPIDELDLSVRSYHYLKLAEIETIGNLVQKTERELLRIPNFGRKSLREVKEILAEMGLDLKGRVY